MISYSWGCLCYDEGMSKMKDESYKVFRGADPEKMAQFVEAAGWATACTIDEENYDNRPIPVNAPEQPKAGI